MSERISSHYAIEMPHPKYSKGKIGYICVSNGSLQINFAFISGYIYKAK